MTISRRNFVKYGLLSGASVALSACGRPVEHKLVSQYQMPEFRLPGQPVYWASTCGECSAGCGIAAKTVENRMIKMEGIPEHPIGRGKLCARGHSAMQDLYHPDRLDAITKDKEWATVLADLTKQMTAANQPLWVVRRLQGTAGGLLVELAKKVNAKIWVMDYPGRVTERRVIKALTNKAELPYYRLEEADYVVTFGGDFLNHGHSPVYHNWAYGEFRQGRNRQRGTMISVAPRLNMTAANADRWLPCRPGTEGWVALAVGNMIAEAGKGAGWPAWAKAITPLRACEVAGVEPELVKRLAYRLVQAKKPLVIADSDAGNYVNGVQSQYIIHALQKLLSGRIETFEPDMVLNLSGDVPAGMIVNTEQALAHAGSGNCKSLWLFNVDPISVLPKSLKADEALKKAGGKVAFSSFKTATTAICDLVLPVQTWLEEWGDQKVQGAGLNVYNVQQPVVSCFFTNARSINDILMYLGTGDLASAQVFPADLKAPGDPKGKFFRDLIRGTADDARWSALLSRGGAWKEASRDWDPYPNRVTAPPVPAKDPGQAPAGWNPYKNLDAINPGAWSDKVTNGLVLTPYASLALGDGTLGTRSWLQELPDPITTIVWGGWVEISEDLAKKLEIERHDLIEVTCTDTGLSVQAPAVPLPSLHPSTVAIPMGDEKADFTKWSSDYTDFGRGSQLFGPYGYTNKGFGKAGYNPLRILKSDVHKESGEPIWVSSSVSIKKLDKTQMVTAMDLRVFNLPRQILPTD